jgi:hypothetical protein
MRICPTSRIARPTEIAVGVRLLAFDETCSVTERLYASMAAVDSGTPRF